MPVGERGFLGGQQAHPQKAEREGRATIISARKPGAWATCGWGHRPPWARPPRHLQPGRQVSWLGDRPPPFRPPRQRQPGHKAEVVRKLPTGRAQEAMKAEVGNRGSLRTRGIRPRCRQAWAEPGHRGRRHGAPREDPGGFLAGHASNERGLNKESDRQSRPDLSPTAGPAMENPFSSCPPPRGHCPHAS